MEIRNRSEQTIGLYENYNLRVIGKTAVYYSNVFNEEHDIITHIGIINTVTNETVYSRVLENNFISMSIFSKCIDEVLFYFSHNTLDSYSIDKTIQDVLISNNGTLFCHRMKQEKVKEEKHNSMIKEVEEHEKLYNSVVVACDEKNYTLCNIGSTFYVLSFQDEEQQRYFNTLQDEQKQFRIDNIDNPQLSFMSVVASQEVDLCCYYSKWYYPNVENLLSKIA